MSRVTTEAICPICRKKKVEGERVLVTWKYVDVQNPLQQVILSAGVLKYECTECGFIYEDAEAAEVRERIVEDYINRTAPIPYKELIDIIRSREDIGPVIADLHIRMLAKYCCDCLTIRVDEELSYAICRKAKDHNKLDGDPHEDLQGGVWWHARPSALKE